MTKTKKQLRAEAVERLKNCVAARFDAESIVIALTSGRHGQSDWSLECDKLIDLLTDDDANDDSTPEKVVSGSEPCVTPESCRQYADQRKQVDDADCESCDSREKLEADVYRAADDMDRFYCGERFIDTRKIIGWLDRQAAITERECCKYIDGAGCDGPEVVHGLNGRIAELQEQVDKYKELNEYNALQYELASEDCDKLQAQVDELKAEHERIVQELVDANTRQCERTNELTAERDNLEADCKDWMKHAMAAENVCHETKQEREQYRKLFGMALDWAHEITMLESSIDEGMA